MYNIMKSLNVQYNIHDKITILKYSHNPTWSLQIKSPTNHFYILLGPRGFPHVQAIYRLRGETVFTGKIASEVDSTIFEKGGP